VNAGLTLSVASFYRAAAEMIAEAVRLAEELKDDQLLSRALIVKAVHHYYAQPKEQAEAGERAVDLCRANGDLWELRNALWITLATAGSFDETAAVYRELEPSPRVSAIRRSLLRPRRSGMDLLRTGNIDRFEEFAKEDLEVCREIGLLGLSQSYAYVGLAHYWSRAGTRR
jgi:hypothetical protein